MTDGDQTRPPKFADADGFADLPEAGDRNDAITDAVVDFIERHR